MKCIGIVWVMLIITAAGCKPFQNAGQQHYPVTPVTKKSYTVLNGVYANKPDTTIGKYYHGPNDRRSADFRPHLMDQFFLSQPKTVYQYRDSTLTDAGQWVKLEFSTAKKLTLSLYYRDRFIFSKQLKGRFKNGYFYGRQKFFIIPVYPLFFGYNFQRTRIGKHQDKLLVDLRQRQWVFLIFSGTNDKVRTTALFTPKQ